MSEHFRPSADRAQRSDDDADGPADEELDPTETLSPAVRRLVKQYELDVATLRGTGPDGRIRVGDVIAVIGGRNPADDAAAAAPSAAAADAGATADAGAAAEAVDTTPDTSDAAQTLAPEAAIEPATTTVFECDAARVLAHRRRRHDEGREVPLVAYFAVATAAAVTETGTFTGNDGAAPPFAVLAAGPQSVESLIRDAAGLTFERAVEAMTRPVHPDAQAVPALRIRHHGASGSVLVQPAGLTARDIAVLGIGRVRREIVVREVDGEEAPRVGSRCYLSLTFRARDADVAAANAWLARCVALIEHWPAD